MGVGNAFEVATEYSAPDPTRGKTTGHMLPIKPYDMALGWTMMSLRKARRAKLEADIAKLSKRLDDPALYTRDRAAFDKATADLAKAQAALEAAELQWLELEELRVAFEGAKGPAPAASGHKKAAAERSQLPLS